MEKRLNAYPVVYIHGFLGYGEDELISKLFPYFGVWNGDARKTARNIGLDCYIPSVGPFTSAWDRACELYAHIRGGRVDYGKVHSEQNGHKRFGKTYKALIPDWGQLDDAGKIKKINLIAHSFGGPTARLFIQLMIEGSKEELEGTPENEISEFFKGGHTNWIHSLTTLAATNNGVSLVQGMGAVPEKGWKVVLTAGGLTQGTFINKIYDFGMDQFNFKKKGKGLFNFGVDSDLIDQYIAQRKDFNLFEMEIDGAEELTKNMRTYDSIYYFSYAGDRTKKLSFANAHRPTLNMWPPLWPLAVITGNYTNYKDRTQPIVTDEWRPNDCCVNVISALAPFNEAQADYESVEKCVPGVWYKMPVEDKDHASYMGVGENMHQYDKFTKEIMLRVCQLKSV